MILYRDGREYVITEIDLLHGRIEALSEDLDLNELGEFKGIEGRIDNHYILTNVRAAFKSYGTATGQLAPITFYYEAIAGVGQKQEDFVDEKSEEDKSLETVKNWKFQPHNEEAEVFKEKLSEEDRKLIKKLKEDFE